MIVIHSIHRRLAELTEKAEQLGGYSQLTVREQMELHHCLQVNAKLVRRLDELKNLAYIAHISGDMDWVQEICQKIDELEVNMI